MRKYKGVYGHFPEPWRKRIQPLANVVDEIQQEIERYIGWKKNYETQFAVKLSVFKYKIADAKLICKIIKHLCPDLKSIEYVELKDTFDVGIKGMVAGETPKLRRVKIQREKERGGRNAA